VRPGIGLRLDQPHDDPALGARHRWRPRGSAPRRRRAGSRRHLAAAEREHRSRGQSPITPAPSPAAPASSAATAEDALAHGDRVVILDNLSTGKRENVPAGATFYQRDISDPGLDELVADEKIDVVSHHAAQVNVRISIADPTADARTNILATLDLISACKKSGVRRLLFASSGGTVYGEQQVYPCDEEHSLHPTSPYGCAKLAVEHYLDAFRVMGDLDPIVFRYANIYGPRQEPKGEAGIVAILAEKLLAGETPRIFDDGEQTLRR
jgi:UDP-glucose 4-epimerase